MYTVESEKEAVFCANNEYVVLPKGVNVYGNMKRYKTNDRKEAETLRMCYGGEFKVVDNG